MSKSRPVIIVYDPSHIYTRGVEFPRQQFATTLWLACWPIGLVVRDTVDDRRYDVVQYEVTPLGGTPNQHQYLRALGSDVELWATQNGNLKRVEVDDADSMPLMRTQDHAAGGPGAGGKRDAGRDVLRVR